MSASAVRLSASEAARRLGVSTKALRLYEQRGLVTPGRTAAGYRFFTPDEMTRAAEVVALRALGLSLSQVARVLGGDAESLELALAAHETTLEGEIRKLMTRMEKVRSVRAGVAGGHGPAVAEVARLLKPSPQFNVAFELPWPWGGERFELNDIRAINYIVGPLGSGKTRFAQCLAETLPNASFLGLERLENDGAGVAARLDADPALKVRVDQTLSWLIDEGATVSAALIALLVSLEAEGHCVLIVDMVEQGLDHDTQEALIACLRHCAKAGAPPLFLITRSSAILDPETIGPEEAILFCPANHSPPIRVAPYPGAPGFEAVATCLASPEVRSRTTGVIAWRPQTA